MTALLGVDPGFAALGLARLELLGNGERVTGLGIVRTAPSPCKRQVLASDDNVRRLGELARALETWITSDVVALCCEAQSWPRNAGSAIKVAMVWGLLVGASERHGLPLLQVSPQDLKRHLTGDASATKQAVQASLERRYGAIRWPEPPSMVEHASDALAACVACLNAPTILLARRMMRESAA